MVGSCQKMSRIIEQVRDFSRITNSSKQFELVNLTHVVKAVLIELEEEIKQKAALIEVDVLPIIEGDFAQLSQLFLNLIDNTLKFNRRMCYPIFDYLSSPIKRKDTNYD